MRARYWWLPLGRLGAIGAIALAIGLAAGLTWALAVALAGCLVLMTAELRHLDRLRDWLRSPEGSVAPEGAGAWEELFAEIHKTRRTQATGRAGVAAALERFVEATQALPDGVVLLDTRNHIDWGNGAAAAQLGIDLARDRDQPIANLVRYPEFAAYLADGASGTPVVLRTSGVTPRVLQIQIIPFGADEKLLLSRDITALEAAETVKTDFIANVSHELRTPLTVMNGFLELLADGLLDPSAAGRQFTLMREQADRMTRLVEDLLTLSRLESGDPHPVDETVDVAAMVANLVEEARSLSNGRHEISAETGDAQLRGAPDELRAAFSNLVSNAIRYTPAGGRIAITWRAEPENEAEFAVHDTGIGIDAEHIPRLTERFYRVDRGRSRETGGTGLGLAIVKHVVLRHDARIAVESTPGRGSRFCCIFPGARVVSADDLRRAA